MSYEYNYYGDLNPAVAGFASIISLALAVFAIVVMWKIFQKAGKEGWKAIVPFLNVYTLFEITWGNGWYFLLVFLAIIPILGYIAVLVLCIITYVKLAKAFGKSDGFAVGLIFLGVIFMAILAFDSSTYLGVPQKDGSFGNNNNPTPAPTPAPAAPVSAPAEPAAPTRYCANCGTALPEDSAFCPNCGTPKAN